MSEFLFFDEMDKLLDGLANAPKIIVNHLLAQKEATLEELQELYTDTSEPYIKAWLRRMMSHLVIEQFWCPKTDKRTYQLTSFAKEMIEHISNFKKPQTSNRAMKEDT